MAVCTAVLYESIYLGAIVLLLTLLLLVDDASLSLALHWEQLRNGFHSSKCFMMGGLRRFNWVGRGSVGPQRGKKYNSVKKKKNSENTLKYLLFVISRNISFCMGLMDLMYLIHTCFFCSCWLKWKIESCRNPTCLEFQRVLPQQ